MLRILIVSCSVGSEMIDLHLNLGINLIFPLGFLLPVVECICCVLSQIKTSLDICENGLVAADLKIALCMQSGLIPFLRTIVKSSLGPLPLCDSVVVCS